MSELLKNSCKAVSTGILVMHSPWFKESGFKFGWKKDKWYEKFAHSIRSKEGKPFQQGNPLNSHQKR